jgi:hypothetical protein
LQDGLKLDLNWLARQGFVRSGANIGSRGIRVDAFVLGRALRFCSRQSWGRQVAYQSQFYDPTNSAHAGKARIKSRLIDDRDPDEWDFPPKPKWMRWATYNRYSDKHERYDEVLDQGLIALAATTLRVRFHPEGGPFCDRTVRSASGP